MTIKKILRVLKPPKDSTTPRADRLCLAVGDFNFELWVHSYLVCTHTRMKFRHFSLQKAFTEAQVLLIVAFYSVVCGVWCVVCGVWCVVCGVWCVVCGVWCVVCGVLCLVCGVWCVVCVVWCVVCGVWCVVCGVRGVCGV